MSEDTGGLEITTAGEGKRDGSSILPRYYRDVKKRYLPATQTREMD